MTITDQGQAVNVKKIPEIQAMDGKDLLAFFRRYKDRTKVDAAKIAFMTEHSISMEKETDTTVTVDGPVNSIAAGENELELSSIANRNKDPKTLAVWEEMHQWYLDEDVVEFWQVDIDSATLNQDTQKEEYKVNYFQGRFTSFEMKAAADSNVELEYTFAIDGNGIWRHWDSLSDEQKLVVEGFKNAYGYHTLAKETDI